MENNNFSAALKVAHTFDVSSDKDSVVVYSISFQPTAENRDKAIAYVKNNPHKMMIEHTECGAKLVEMGLEGNSTLHKDDVMMVWSEASRRFIASASGNVTAFVDNADKRSVFRTIELPNILKNEKILTVNHIDKKKFAKNFA